VELRKMLFERSRKIILSRRLNGKNEKTYEDDF